MVSAPICVNKLKVRMVQPVPTKAVLQPAKAATMCKAPHAESRPPLPITPFLLVQNPSSKQITCGQSQTTPKGIVDG